MEKTKTKSERGMEEYKLWRGSNLRGHRMIGQYIINRYELTEEDLHELVKNQNMWFARSHRAKKKKKREEEKKLQDKRDKEKLIDK